MRMWINEKDNLFDVWIQQGVNQPDLSISLPIKQPPSDLRNHPRLSTYMFQAIHNNLAGQEY